MPVSEQVRALRRVIGLSQSGLARRLGVTRDAVASWEQGKREPGAINYLRMAGLCDGDLAASFTRRAGSAPTAPDPDRLARIEDQLTILVRAVEAMRADLAAVAGRPPSVRLAPPIRIRK